LDHWDKGREPFDPSEGKDAASDGLTSCIASDEPHLKHGDHAFLHFIGAYRFQRRRLSATGRNSFLITVKLMKEW
jgi:hypothetical protein